MKPNIRTIVLAVLVLTTLAACSDNEYMKPQKIEGQGLLSAEEVDLSPDGSVFNLTVTADTKWELLSVPEWLEVDKSKGNAGTTSIQLTADVNMTREDRSATLQFVNRRTSDLITEVVVNQEYPYLSIDWSEYNFLWNQCEKFDQQPHILSISSNINWIIRESEQGLEHFSLSAKEGFKDFELNVIPVRDNIGKELYYGGFEVIPVKILQDGSFKEIGEEGVDRYVVSVSQQNLKFLINDDVDDVSVSCNDINTETTELVIDSESPWTVTECPDWVNLNVRSGNGVTRLNINAVGVAPERNPREGNVRLLSEAGSYRDIQVTQDGYLWEITSEGSPAFSLDFEIDNPGTSEYTFELATHGPWEIKNIPDWLEITPSSCDTNNPEGKPQVINVKSKGINYEETERSGKMVLSRSVKPAGVLEDQAELIDVSMNVAQQRFRLEFSGDPAIGDMPTMDTKKHNLSIVSTGEWRLEYPEDWIEVSMPSGTESHQITMNAKNGNPNLDKDRTGLITLVSTSHEKVGKTLKKTLDIKQRKYTFELSKDKIEKLPAYLGAFESHRILVKCSANWQVESKPEWVSVSPMSGDGTDDVEIVVTPTANLTYSAREGTVVVKSLYNNRTLSVSMSQDAFVFDRASKAFNDIPEMNPQPYNVGFDLTADATWEVQECASWIKPSVRSGKGRADIRFTPDQNLQTEPRTGKVVIRCNQVSDTKEISFSQLKYQFVSDKVDWHYDELGKDTETLEVISSGPWEFVGKPEWITASASSGSSTQTVTVKPQVNTLLEQRTASFSVKSRLNNLTRQINVTQDAFKFDSGSQEFKYGTLEERQDFVEILCSGAWNAENCPSWITLSDRSGVGSTAGVRQKVTLTSSKNLTEAERTGSIRFSSRDNPGFVKVVSVRQDKFDFEINQRNFEFPVLNPERKNVNVVCSGEWSVKSSEPWVEVSPLSGTGGGEVTVIPQENLTMSPRNAVVTFTSTLNNLKRELNVSQQAFVFNVDSRKLDFSANSANSNTVVVDCTAEWTVSCPSDWVNISTENGSGRGSFSVSVDLNKESSPRQATVTVRSTRNDVTHTIDVTQSGFVFEVDQTSLSFDADSDNSYMVSVDCTDGWTVSCPDEWVKINGNSGIGKGFFNVSAAHNVETSDRSAVITVTSTLNDKTLSVNVIQNKYEWIVTGPGNTVKFDPCNPESYQFNVKCSGSWSVDAADSWIILRKDQGRVTVTAQRNPDKTERTTQIRITSDDNTSLVYEISAVQGGHFLEVSPGSVELDAEGGEITLNVDSSCSFEVSVPSDWLKQQSVEGNKVSLFAEPNTSEETRAQKVIIFCDGLQSYVTISQNGRQENI